MIETVIGKIARPKGVRIDPDMPKTRSGKIMRRVLATISNTMDIGDVSTLANPEIVGQIRVTALVWQAVHCHLVRSHSAFDIVADGFDRTSFHGFLAKRRLLRGGRLLKHIGVAAVVAAHEISGCGFPAQVAVNALVIDVKRSGHVFRVFIRNVCHRFCFVSCRRKFD